MHKIVVILFFRISCCLITFNHKYPPTEKITLPRSLALSKTGLGVFATQNLTSGTIVEVAPFLIGEKISSCLAKYHSQARPEVAEYHSLSHESLILPLGILALFNHRDNFNVRRYSSKRFRFFETVRDVKKGEELVISYGGPEWFQEETILEESSPSPDMSQLQGTSLYFAPSHQKRRALGIFTTSAFVAGAFVEMCIVIPLENNTPDWVYCARRNYEGHQVLVLGRCALFISDSSPNSSNIRAYESTFHGRKSFEVRATRDIQAHDELVLHSQTQPCVIPAAESKFDMYSLTRNMEL